MMSTEKLQFHTEDTVSFPAVVRDESVADFLLAAKGVGFTEDVANRIADDLRAKFDKGQAEHGGNLQLRDCMKELYHEFLDQWHYTSGLLSNLEQGQKNGADLQREIRALAQVRTDTVRILKVLLSINE